MDAQFQTAQTDPKLEVQQSFLDSEPSEATGSMEYLDEYAMDVQQSLNGIGSSSEIIESLELLNGNAFNAQQPFQALPEIKEKRIKFIRNF